jgi:hypothetical protein
MAGALPLVKRNHGNATLLCTFTASSKFIMFKSEIVPPETIMPPSMNFSVHSTGSVDIVDAGLVGKVFLRFFVVF